MQTSDLLNHSYVSNDVFDAFYVDYIEFEKYVDEISLTLPAPCILEICRKMKINVNFYFHTSLWYLKRFYEGLQGLHKTFWGNTKKCENKCKLIFSLRPGSGWEGLNIKNAVCEKSGSNNDQSKLQFLEAEILKLRNENTSLKDDNKSKLKIIESLTTCQRSCTIVNNKKLHLKPRMRTHKQKTAGNK